VLKRICAFRVYQICYAKWQLQNRIKFIPSIYLELFTRTKRSTFDFELSRESFLRRHETFVRPCRAPTSGPSNRKSTRIPVPSRLRTALNKNGACSWRLCQAEQRFDFVESFRNRSRGDRKPFRRSPQALPDPDAIDESGFRSSQSVKFGIFDI